MLGDLHSVSVMDEPFELTIRMSVGDCSVRYGWMDDFLLQEAAPSGPLMRAKSYITKPVLAIQGNRHQALYILILGVFIDVRWSR